MRCTVGHASAPAVDVNGSIGIVLTLRLVVSPSVGSRVVATVEMSVGRVANVAVAVLGVADADIVAVAVVFAKRVAAAPVTDGGSDATGLGEGRALACTTA